MKQVNALDQQAKSLANSEPKQKFALTGELREELNSWGMLYAGKRETENQISVAGLKLHDLFFASGYRKEHFCNLDDTQKTVNPELIGLRDQVLDSIVAGVVEKSPRFTNLYRKEKSTLSLDQQSDQRVLQEIVKNAYNNFKSALDRKEASAKKGGRSADKTSPLGMVAKDIQSAIDRIKGLKEAYHGSVDHVKILTNINAEIKKLDVIKK
jgi:hypothetical protein